MKTKIATRESSPQRTPCRIEYRLPCSALQRLHTCCPSLAPLQSVLDTKFSTFIDLKHRIDEKESSRSEDKGEREAGRTEVPLVCEHNGRKNGPLAPMRLTFFGMVSIALKRSL